MEVSLKSLIHFSLKSVLNLTMAQQKHIIYTKLQNHVFWERKAMVSLRKKKNNLIIKSLKVNEKVFIY